MVPPRFCDSNLDTRSGTSKPHSRWQTPCQLPVVAISSSELVELISSTTRLDDLRQGRLTLGLSSSKSTKRTRLKNFATFLREESASGRENLLFHLLENWPFHSLRSSKHCFPVGFLRRRLYLTPERSGECSNPLFSSRRFLHLR